MNSTLFVDVKVSLPLIHLPNPSVRVLPNTVDIRPPLIISVSEK